jgi:3-hydroxyisobutyrate dehydrogenase
VSVTAASRLGPGSGALLVGAGAMGAPMAANLVAAGHHLVVHDADAARAEQVAADAGARAVGPQGLAGAAGEADVVLLMLPDSPAVEDVLTGSGGVLAAMRGGTVLLAARAAERGVAWADAPVSGGVSKAVTGELAIMVGSSDGTYRLIKPLLDVLGADVRLVGPPGAGHAMKALNNLLSAVGLAAASEVLSIGANFGLDPSVMLGVLNSSTGRNHATEVKMERFVLSRAFDSGFAMHLMVKDIGTALDVARDTRTPVPLAAACLEQWTAAARDLGPRADHTQIATYVEARAGTLLDTTGDKKET